MWRTFATAPSSMEWLSSWATGELPTSPPSLSDLSQKYTTHWPSNINFPPSLPPSLPQFCQATWLKGVSDAVCAAINTKYSLLSFGREK